MALAPKTVYTYPLDGNSRTFDINFEYLARKFIQIALIGTDRKELVLNTDFRFLTRTQVQTMETWGPAQGYTMIEIRRMTSATERLVDFSDGSILRAYDLNISSIQSMHIAEEARDMATYGITVNNDGELDARGRRITNLGEAVDPSDAVTLGQVKDWDNSAFNSATAAKESATAANLYMNNSAFWANESAKSAAEAQNLPRTMRVRPEEPELEFLPIISVRANKIIGFDDLGMPTVFLPASGSATELQLMLASSTGVTLVGNAVDKRELSYAEFGKGVDLVKGALRTFDSVEDLLGTSFPVGTRAWLNSYHKGVLLGGSMIEFKDLPKSGHDGVVTFSPTKTWDGTKESLFGFYQKDDTAGNGVWVRSLEGKILVEFAGATRTGDDFLQIQKALNVGATLNVEVVGGGTYHSSGNLIVETYRTYPPVYMDFNQSGLKLNKLVFTGNSGSAITAASPMAQVIINRLKGPDASAGYTNGLRIMGLGDAHHAIGWWGGFTNGVLFEEAFSVSVNCGWAEDCIRGVYILRSNENKINGGHIGGGFNQSLVNPLSCEIGIAISPGSSSNHINSNVEYCRRTQTAMGIQDFGTGTRFRGYTESCSAHNIYAAGIDGIFEVLAGGTNVEEPSAYFAGSSNEIKMLTSIDYSEETVDGANGTLHFSLLQRFEQSGTGIISSPRGFGTLNGGDRDEINRVRQSSTLLGTSWNRSSNLGGVSWAALGAENVNTAYTQMGYNRATRVVIPKATSQDQIYRAIQTGMFVPVGEFSAGVMMKVVSGDVDVMVRVIYDGGTKQARAVARIGKSDTFFRIGSTFMSSEQDANATYELSFRANAQSTVLFHTCYQVPKGDVRWPKDNHGTTLRSNNMVGRELDGNLLNGGLRVNGQIFGTLSAVNVAPASIDPVIEDFEVVLVDSSGAPANIILPAGTEGQKLIVKRLGTPGELNLLAQNTSIDGRAILPMSVWQSIRLIYSASQGWLTI